MSICNWDKSFCVPVHSAFGKLRHSHLLKRPTLAYSFARISTTGLGGSPLTVNCNHRRQTAPDSSGHSTLANRNVKLLSIFTRAYLPSSVCRCFIRCLGLASQERAQSRAESQQNLHRCTFQKRQCCRFGKSLPFGSTWNDEPPARSDAARTRHSSRAARD